MKLSTLGPFHGYRRQWLGRDLVAGVVLSALLVPQGMAYAELAGLPAVTGLYTTILCLIGYALFGPSRILVTGPDSALGSMIAATILPLMVAGGDPATAVVLASLLALFTGLMMVLAGVGGLGFVADLLSKPTMLGYMNGLAVTILVGQLPKLCGFSVDADDFIGDVTGFVAGIAAGEAVPAAVAVGVLCLVVILALPRVMPKIPAVLVGVLVALAASALFGLGDRGVKLVGTLPQGLPSFQFPVVAPGDILPLLVGAIGVSLVALTDTISTATSFAARRGEHVDGNREMIGIGAANIAASLFQGFPVSTSGSRTAVAEQSGAKSQLTGLVGAGMVALMLVAFPSLLADLPQPALGAVVIAASLSLADIPGAVRLYHQRRTDFLVAAVAFLGVTLLGILPGIVVAIMLSVANVFRRLWMPYRGLLGRVPGESGYHNVAHHDDAEVVAGCRLYFFEAPIIFANARTFREEVRALAESEPKPRWIVVAAEPVSDVDTTACDMLEEVVAEMDAQGQRLVFAEMKSVVRAKLEAFGLLSVLGPDRFYPSVEAAVDDYLSATGDRWEPAGEL